MAEVTETKDGKVILECDCGIVHKLKYNPETEQIEIKSSISKKPEDKKDDGTKAENKRTSIFQH